MSFNILFTSIGRRVFLVQHFKKVLLDLGLEGKLVGADMSLSAPAMHVIDKKYQICRVMDGDYVPQLLDICERENIKLLVPLIDTELLVLAENKGQFGKMGVTALVSDPEVIQITMNKYNTHEFFVKHSIDTPRVFDANKVLQKGGIDYPLLMKPVSGSASKGIIKINNKKELKFFKERIPNAMLQEYIDGYEYTLDILADFDGRVRCVVPRRRLEVRAGEVSKGMTEKDEEIITTGKKAVEALKGAIGPITAQGFLTEEGRFKLTEINPRFGGGHPLAIKAGADYPRWIIEMILGRDPEIKLDSWEDGLVMLRYDEAVFIRHEDIQGEMYDGICL